MKSKNYILKYTLLMYLSIGGFFLFMKLLNLEQNSMLRLLNIVILAFFSVLMAKAILKDKGEVNYLEGLISIFITNLAAVVLSAISLFIYLTYIDTSLLPEIQNTIWFAGDISTILVAGAIFMEGAASAVIISFAVMQYYKNDTVLKKSINK